MAVSFSVSQFGGDIFTVLLMFKPKRFMCSEIVDNYNDAKQTTSRNRETSMSLCSLILKGNKYMKRGNISSLNIKQLISERIQIAKR